jgi:hypothetical protein
MISLQEIRPQTEAICPTNGQPGKPVDTLTLKAMLNRPLSEIRNVRYRFCPDPECPTVYYSEDGLQVFTEADLRERVYQKHLDEADGLVCYCFRHTVGEVRERGVAVVEAINAGIKKGQCACDIRNPQGSCCLGNVRAVMRRIQ